MQYGIGAYVGRGFADLLEVASSSPGTAADESPHSLILSYDDRSGSTFQGI